MDMSTDIRALVLGRVGADLYPLQERTPLEEVLTFERFVGGFAGNVATGLARLGVTTAIVSAVGDDGHGRFVRRFLAGEGVDLRWLGVHPTLRTALAFCELWPPNDFPLTFYRTPTCPDWELTEDDLPLELLATVPLLYVTGTGLAQEPSRSTTLAALRARQLAARAASPAGSGGPALTTILDLDWRAVLWSSPDEYPGLISAAAGLADVLLGGAAEFAAAELDPASSLELGPSVAVEKMGPDGARVFRAGSVVNVPGLPVPVTNGLGAGDAFAAAFGAALLAGMGPEDAARQG
ncbi:MAG: 5-dehydro-2-deoxygluconokinase, partial [Chloroflexi bacterium]|nr:5-dehydro-2-deoxygluconokinase [Chloroflexota bacterium]